MHIIFHQIFVLLTNHADELFTVWVYDGDGGAVHEFSFTEGNPEPGYALVYDADRQRFRQRRAFEQAEDEAGVERVPGTGRVDDLGPIGRQAQRFVSPHDEGTIRAFEMVAFDGRKPADVAEELSISLNDVYLAKHRCLKRLREIISQLEQLYEVA